MQEVIEVMHLDVHTLARVVRHEALETVVVLAELCELGKKRT